MHMYLFVTIYNVLLKLTVCFKCFPELKVTKEKVKPAPSKKGTRLACSFVNIFLAEMCPLRVRDHFLHFGVVKHAVTFLIQF